MSCKTENKPKCVKIFDLDEFEKLLKGVQVASCMLTEAHHVVDEESVIKRVSALTLGGLSGGDKCSCCGAGPFESRAQQTAHYKHHWHTYNLKRRLFGKNPLTLPEFNSRQDDNSSVSGSDSETESPKQSDQSSELFAAATRHCKAFFTNTEGKVFCIYRCVLHHRKEDLSTDGDGKKWIQKCRSLTTPGNQRWAVLMVSGGHFAGAVFTGSAPVVHKTLHSYLVRRGQGQAQGSRDQHGNAPKSAGASLRRYNQAQFSQHVQDILATWTEDLAGCSLILYRAVGPISQSALFGKTSPINKDDPRIRSMPFPTRKPTFKEVQRAHEVVANVDVYETMEQFQKALMSSRAAPRPGSDGSGAERPSRKKTTPTKPIDRAKSREPIARELPTQMMSSEDEGPTFIDSETPAGWTKILSEQTKGTISNSKKDLLNDNAVEAPFSSDDENQNVAEKTQPTKKKKKKKTEDQKRDQKKTPKISDSVKKMWKAISGPEPTCLETIFECYENAGEIERACNTVDPSDGNTALHKAAIAEKPDVVTGILSAGGDPSARNHRLETPYAATPHHATRVAFRMFQAQFPDKYNYAKSHIPGPLTPELLEQELEKKAAQKRAKRKKDKEKQIEKIKSNNFMQLKDQDKLKSTEARCFLCGVQLPKAPFQYDDFKFCSIKCLQNHRSLRPLNMPV